MQTTAQDLGTLHTDYCTWYNNIIGRRYTLLQLVPASTVISLAVPIFSNPTSNPLRNLVLPFGLAGAFFIVGLFFVMLVSIEDGEKVLARIYDLERRMTLQGTLWMPMALRSTVSRTASAFIFSIALAGWVCVAFWFVFPGTAIYLALVIAVASNIVSIPFFNGKVVPSSI